MLDHTNKHLKAALRILRHLKADPRRRLYINKNESMNIHIFTGADWSGSRKYIRITIEYDTYLWGNSVTWRSNKRPVVSRSREEAEVRALAFDLCEGLWLKRVSEELGQTISSPTRIYCDNISAIIMAENPVQHDKPKHVEYMCKYYFQIVLGRP